MNVEGKQHRLKGGPTTKGSNTSNATWQLGATWSPEIHKMKAWWTCYSKGTCGSKSSHDSRCTMMDKNCIWPLKNYQHASDVEWKDVQGLRERVKFILQKKIELPQGNMPQHSF
jgi:hypothetical protein